jgi:hypothetical protein
MAQTIVQNQTDYFLHSDSIVENADAFFDKLETIADRLGIDSDWLMQVFYIETAAFIHNNIIDHRRKNSIGCVGLIQFCPKGGQTTIAKNGAQLAAMTNVEQLSYVEKFIQPYKGKIQEYADLHLAIFYPAYLGKSDSTIFPSKVQKGNPYFFKGTNGTLAAFREKCRTDYNKEMRKLNGETGTDLKTTYEQPIQDEQTNWLKIGGFSLLAIIIIAFIFILISKNGKHNDYQPADLRTLPIA